LSHTVNIRSQAFSCQRRQLFEARFVAAPSPLDQFKLVLLLIHAGLLSKTIATAQNQKLLLSATEDAKCNVFSRILPIDGRPRQPILPLEYVFGGPLVLWAHNQLFLPYL
jgi:hypothetical protein